MIKLKTGLSLLALIAMGAQGHAADLCDMGSAAALKTAAVQQELMVAGFTCNADAQYNRFVLANRPALQASDAALMTYFRERDGNEAGYDSYKTKLANLSASRSAADGPRYCQAIARDFAAAEGRTLQDFIAGQRLLIAAPEACAVKFDQSEIALAGPSYALPATPYGAVPMPTARRQAANTAPTDGYRNSAADEDWRDDRYSSYGPPPGWLPPRPPPRRDWYGRSAYNGYYND
jgi:hypothetical protein